jgi:3'-phosphoadenosine 5'-phosphosulfate sulfotransferase
MSKIDLKHKLDEQAFEKLRAVVKRNTDISNLNEENIKTVKEALRLLTTWLEEVYNLDIKPIDMDEGATDIDKLFKDSN